MTVPTVLATIVRRFVTARAGCAAPPTATVLIEDLTTVRGEQDSRKVSDIRNAVRVSGFFGRSYTIRSWHLLSSSRAQQGGSVARSPCASPPRAVASSGSTGTTRG